MTRKPNVRSNVLAARSSFWETLPQEGAVKPNVRRAVSDSQSAVPGLYDQLVHLKDWTEETAELCSVAEAREQSICPTTSLEGPLECCSREDSAMRLSSGTRPSFGSTVQPAAPAAIQNVTLRASSGSAQAGQSSRQSRERSFCRSSFSATRSYETRKRRHRQRTFAMEELESSSISHMSLQATDPVMTETQETSSDGKKQNRLLGMAAKSLTAAEHKLRYVMKSALYQSTGPLQASHS